ncbi:MAG: glycosyltransferase family 4 protein [Bacteroidota bacterium]|nr:glycosyltransferase family 4 protein [Bacteroidota bacterium]
MVSEKKGIYDSSSFGKDISLIKKMYSQKGGIAHYLNGERDVRFGTFFKGVRGWKFTASFHEPPSAIHAEIKDFKYLKKLDGAIAVGMNQLNLLNEVLGGKAVQYIPHGIDTNFFTPVHEEWEQFTCLFVGIHLRDFEVLSQLAFELKKRFPKFKLRAVIRKDYMALLPKIDYVEVYSGISDEKLRELYRSSSLLLLPLKDVTACNAILEALACGLPIVTTDILGNRGYLDESCSFMIKNNNMHDTIDVVTQLFNDESLNKQMRKNARIQAAKFSWEQVAKEMVLYYKTNFDY